MVTRLACLLLGALLGSGLLGAEDQGPVLWGDGGGRVWKWEDGQKVYLTDEGLNLVLGGVSEHQAWGWSQEAGLSRLFTLDLPKKKEPSSTRSDKAPKKEEPPPQPRFMKSRFPTPDRLDRVGDTTLLIYGALTGEPRWEVWKGAQMLASRAYDDGRVIYAASLGPVEGWIIVGRLADATPWLEVSGRWIEPPEGWRGRLTVAAWVAPDDKSAAQPHAAGWGASGKELARPLFWGPEGWTQATDPAYPILGAPGDQGTVLLAGWQADPDTGALRPWFWDGEKATVPGGAAEGQPQAFSTGGKGGSLLLVRHQSAPWFTWEDGKKGVPIEGLGPEDRVVTVDSPSPKASP